MGTVQHYRRGQQSFALYIGPDLYDSLEDLDLVGRLVRTAEYVFVLSQTDVNPSLRIAVLEKPALDEPCADAGVLTGNLSTAAVADLLDGFRIEQSP
jgi:hypothetical protein